jgi:hypothetical protein
VNGGHDKILSEVRKGSILAKKGRLQEAEVDAKRPTELSRQLIDARKLVEREIESITK